MRIKKNQVMTNDVFKDIGFSEEEAYNLKVRADLMISIREYIRQRGLTQAAAAKLFRIDQPQISRLMSGKIHLFTVDKLLLILTRAGIKVQLKIAA
jgi:predicted XRE-type DNA-binding protein